MTSKEEQEEIDRALDAALDDLDDDDNDFDQPPKVPKNELSTTTEPSVNTDDTDAADSTAASVKSTSSKSLEENKGKPRPMMGPPRPPVADENAEDKMISNMMQQMLQLDQQGGDAPDELFGQLMQSMPSQLGSKSLSLENTPKKEKGAARAGKSKEKGSTSSNEGSVDQAISSLLEGMSKEKLSDEGVRNEPSVPGEVDMLEKLMQGFGGDGDGGDYNADAMIDGMMEQLMSKDLMYEPIKQFATSFPPWLEERRDTMSKEDYAK
jgi:peroxin-19